MNREDLATAAKRSGAAASRIRAVRPCGGGCINETAVLALEDGTALFVKVNRRRARMFPAEAAGLDALRTPGGPRIPKVRGLWSADDAEYLFLEYLDAARPIPRFDAVLGERLATMHRANRSRKWGFDHDNFIGATPQVNTWHTSWPTFFAACRLQPQLDRAASAGLGSPTMYQLVQRVIDRLDTLLPEPEEGPCIVHGDLWNGNAMCDDRGEPALIDPAVYYGHREVDLAMARLFGGFSSSFFAAYEAAWPLEPGAEERVDLYNLYHLLNHLNLFGEGYASSVLRIARRYA